MIHIHILCFTLLLARALCQPASFDAREDLLSIFYNGVVAFQNCSGTHVLPSNLNYTLYTQEHQQNGILLNSTNLGAVNPKNRVIFIIHGWIENGSQGWIIKMKDAYLDQTPANVIVLDWSDYAQNFKYGASFCAVPQVGKITGVFIYTLTTELNLDLNKTQVVGFSLGGQIAGYAGQEVQNQTGGAKIGRIIGLDTAGPGFLGLPVDKRLDRTDALFVQGIHTSNWQFGYTPAYATIDFQLNHGVVSKCGAVQPGCPLNPGVSNNSSMDLAVLLPYVFCNHVRAVAFFTESITSTDLVGVSCDSCMEFALGMCKSRTTAVMGEHCSFTVSGVFYLNTNANPPYAKKDARSTEK